MFQNMTFHSSRGAASMEKLNLGKLQDWIDMGRIDPTQTITMKEIYDSNIVGKIKHGVKLLGKVLFCFGLWQAHADNTMHCITYQFMLCGTCRIKRN